MKKHTKKANEAEVNLSKSLRSVSLLSRSNLSIDDRMVKRSLKRHDPNILSVCSCKEEKKSTDPITPAKALKDFPQNLTPFEKKEILKYPEIYYLSKSLKKHGAKFYDEKGYYLTFVADQIAYRYEILHLIGEGSFGIVISCIDHRFQTPVAVKILRKGKEFEELGIVETQNLDGINREGEEDVIIEKIDSFIFREHFCIVFELLSLDLYQYLKKNHFRGMEVNVVRRIAVQLLIGLKQVHQSGYIHCDLKPENILFKALNKSSVKIIDFGSACAEKQQVFSYIQSRYYRAPEVILEMEYDSKIDLWSLGCILFELTTGSPLFTGVSEIDQLCKIAEVLGDFPSRLVQCSKRKNELFDEDGKLLAMEFHERSNQSLGNLLNVKDTYFVDFLLECLKTDPAQRISAESALLHPWIKRNKLKGSRSLRKFHKSLIFV